MTDGVPVAVCGRCEHVVFPHRLLCPRCGFPEWRRGWISSGTVEEATVVRRAVGGAMAFAPLGTVQLSGGPKVIARLEPGASDGCAVRLAYADGVPVATAQEPPHAGEPS